MPHNLLKEYPQCLELLHLDNYNRIQSLKRIFKRDIEDNHNFIFNKKVIRPIKAKDGLTAMEVLFQHLTHESIVEKRNGRNYSSRNVFEIERSKRLHWIKFLVDGNKRNNIEIFSVKERDKEKRKDVIKTYIYDIDQKYIIVFEPQRSNKDYYLLTAFYLDKPWGEKQMKKKLKKKLTELY